MTAAGSPRPAEPATLGCALVVDDAEDLRLLMTQVLRADGFDTVDAASGSEALERLRELGPERVRIVVLDVQMPVVDGWHVLGCIRSDPAVYGSPAVLMCTVKNSAADRARASELGAQDYLAKPFAIAELSAKARRLALVGRH